jgi:transmembrane sensor
MDISLQRRVRFLMGKYLEDKCTVRELEELFDIISKHHDDKTIADIIAFEDQRTSQTPAQVPEKISLSIFAAIRQRLSLEQTPAPQVVFRSQRLRYLKIAAAILVLAVCAAVLFLTLHQPKYQIVSTAYGEIREVTLPDHSVVTLNGNSTLTYDSKLTTASTREVMISGEAFFHVVHTKNNQKFKVHTSNNVTIEVLGTEFTVNERRSKTRVVLHSGKILLDIEEKEGHKDILMNTGEFVEVSENDSQIVRKQVDSRLYFSWKNKMLVFKDTPLRDIVAILEDSYGIKTIVRDTTILNERFTATYPSDNIDVLIKALEKSFAIRIDAKSGMITVGE